MAIKKHTAKRISAGEYMYRGNMAQDTTGYIPMGGYLPLLPNMSYFKNDTDYDCGNPVIKKWKEK